MKQRTMMGEMIFIDISNESDHRPMERLGCEREASLCQAISCVSKRGAI